MEPGGGTYREIDGIRTYIVEAGHGPNVVLLHGQPPGASVHVVWARNCDYLVNAGFHVYAFDQVGFGRSDNDPTDFTRERRLRHVRAFIDAMELERYSLWGMSDGSNLACLIALEDARVERLILMASGSLSPRPSHITPELAREQAALRASYTPSVENARSYLQRELVDHTVMTDEFLHEFVAMSSGKNFDAYRARAALPDSPPIYDELQRLRMPRLLLWGTRDSGGIERGVLLFQKVPGAELHVFDDCGHWVEIDQADRVNRLVRDFLSPA